MNREKEEDNMQTGRRSGGTIGVGKAYLEKYNGFPFSVGLDIFPLDFIAPTKEDDDFQCELIKIVNDVAQFGREVNAMDTEATKEILDIFEEHIQKV